jgi:hypothetical protein
MGVVGHARHKGVSRLRDGRARLWTDRPVADRYAHIVSPCDRLSANAERLAVELALARIPDLHSVRRPAVAVAAGALLATALVDDVDAVNGTTLALHQD